MSAASGGMRSSSAVPAVHGAPPALRVAPVGRHAALSAGHPLVARVMEGVIDAGGTAVDAGVAGCLAACVVQVDMCNLGGIAPIVIRPAGACAGIAIDGVGTWGAATDLATHRERHGDELPLGAPSAVVPAAVSALFEALAGFGTWTAADVLTPAIALAAEGFVLDEHTARSLRLLAPVYARWTSSIAILWPSGAPPRAGELLAQPALAALLGHLARADSSARAAGADRQAGIAAARRAFYEGPIAARIAAITHTGGGTLTAADLAAYRSEVATATSATAFGWTLHVPGFHSQAPMLLQALMILERTGAGDEPGGALHIHLQAEAFKLAAADREAFYGDPRHVEVDAKRLLCAEHANELAELVDPGRARPYAPRGLAGTVTRRDTTYVGCVDDRGNAFSASPSDTIDGAPLDPELGILVSPRGVQSKLDAEHPAAIGPGRRPRLTPSPAIALGPGADPRVMALGCPGGDVICQAMAQVFVSVAHFGVAPQHAVERPRAATFDLPGSFFPFPHEHGRLAIEARAGANTINALTARGHRVTRWPDWEFDAGAAALAMDLTDPGAEGRVLISAADPRRSGTALAW